MEIYEKLQEFIDIVKKQQQKLEKLREEIKQELKQELMDELKEEQVEREIYIFKEPYPQYSFEDINNIIDLLIKPESYAITGQTVFLGGV